MAEIIIVSDGPRYTPESPSRRRFSKETPVISEKPSTIFAYAALAFAITCTTAFITEKIGFAATILTFYINSSLTTPLLLTAIAIGLITAIIYSPKEDTQKKHALYGAFFVFQGLILSPLVMFNLDAFLAASGATVGVVVGLGALSTSLKESFERYEKIMKIALGAICLTSISALVLPGSASLLALKISLIGGLALFTGLVIHALYTYIICVNILISQVDLLNTLGKIFGRNKKQ